LEFVLRVDSKGRILIPKEVRSMLDIRDVVTARVEGKKLVIEPIEDPIELLTTTLIQGTKDVEKEIGRLRQAALEEARKRVEERWS